MILLYADDWGVGNLAPGEGYNETFELAPVNVDDDPARVLETTQGTGLNLDVNLLTGLVTLYSYMLLRLGLSGIVRFSPTKMFRLLFSFCLETSKLSVPPAISHG